MFIYPFESGRVKVGDTMMSLPTTTTKWQQERHHDPLPWGCGMFIYPFESGRVKVGGTMMSLPTTTQNGSKERHHDPLP